MKKHYLMAVDTEDDGKGNVLLFCFVHECGANYFTNREEALFFLSRFANDKKKEKLKVELWATNLEYDLVNLFGAEYISQCKLIFGKAYLVGADWIKHNVKFRDTVRHFPISVADWGELVGLEKLEKKLFEKGKKKEIVVTFAQLLKRCVRDATITYRAAKFLYEFYGEFDIKPRLTLASTALSIWRENYWKKSIFFPDLEIVETARASYYGGRTEAFSIGAFKAAKSIDAASMFPWAMVSEELPLPWGAYSRSKILDPMGFYYASVSYYGDIPCLPFRSENGLIYPIGNFKGWYTGEELIYAETQGYDIKIRKGYTFLEKSAPFNDYVSDMFVRKNKSRGPKRLGYKLLLNSLYGKFSQRGEKIEAMQLEEFAQLKNQPEDFRIWNGIAIFKVEGTPPIWGNCVWPAFVTARARIRLHKELRKVYDKGGRILYCDTDSIIYLGAHSLLYPQKVNRPGEFEQRGYYKKVIIAGKKEYGFLLENGKWDVRIKGVPSVAREIYLREGKAKFQRPVRLREAMRRDLQANVWRDYEKIRRVSFIHRERAADGSLLPIKIDR